jgi:hypothetical protein
MTLCEDDETNEGNHLIGNIKCVNKKLLFPIKLE